MLILVTAPIMPRSAPSFAAMAASQPRQSHRPCLAPEGGRPALIAEFPLRKVARERQYVHTTAGHPTSDGSSAGTNANLGWLSQEAADQELAWPAGSLAYV